MRGQGYDNGSNMKGKNVGVQKRILDLNPRAFFVPCGSHSLNLVVNDAGFSCTLAVNFFNNIQELYNFFSGSNHRWNILTNHVTNLTVKPLSETPWESRINALEPLRYHIDEIYDAVYESTLDSMIDAFGKCTAMGIAKKITDFKFLCCLVTFYDVLFKINLVSKTLQMKTVDLQGALKLIESVKYFFGELGIRKWTE
ncbi:zinc finger MYM-type protein 1-like [Hydra vulgaris]|uniref:Zinc finger MYM-type protein 1-like n=1 Tax=Hydra vulgaris TaxID=6087 RepID=A0ABM4BNS3_HYDVU